MPNQQFLSPQHDVIAKFFDDQPEEVRELFQYALAMLMVEDTKAKIVERHRVDNLEYLTIETIAGDVFEIIQPQVSEDLLTTLRALARDVLDQDKASNDNA
jgi:hypothetical protein